MFSQKTLEILLTLHEMNGINISETKNYFMKMSEKVSKNGKEGNQMKKLTALLLVGVMALSLVGCGDSSTPKTTDSTGDTKTETAG